MMSKLNDALKPILLANGFEKIHIISDDITKYNWDYQYRNGQYYIYFSEGDNYIRASYNNGRLHYLNEAQLDRVIAYFTKYGKAPACTTNDVDTSTNTDSKQLIDEFALALISNSNIMHYTTDARSIYQRAQEFIDARKEFVNKS